MTSGMTPSPPPAHDMAPATSPNPPAARPVVANTGARLPRRSAIAYPTLRTASAASATRLGTSQVGSAGTAEAAPLGRSVSDNRARIANTAEQIAVNARYPRVAPVRIRPRATAAKPPTASAVRTVQLMNARFWAIRSAATARV